MSSAAALKTFEAANRIVLVAEAGDGGIDGLFHHNEEEQKALRDQKPWVNDAMYFKKTKVSAVALIKMAMHARSGSPLEVMGILQGKIAENAIIVTDSFALPVEGTETRVNAPDSAVEYMYQYVANLEKTGRLDKVVGWYHSHPGYGCWLSKIDVDTESLHQNHEDPYVALVIDPIHTMSAGKVELGAFRTYPSGYIAPDGKPREYQTIPLEKVKDYGSCCNMYYQLEISYFKSTSDATLLSLLWNKYWINTLSSNPLLSNQEYISSRVKDLSAKLEETRGHMNSGPMGGMIPFAASKENNLEKLAHDGSSISSEALQGFASQALKVALFNSLAVTPSQAGTEH